MKASDYKKLVLRAVTSGKPNDRWERDIGFRTLTRASFGSRSKAIELVKGLIQHWSSINVDEQMESMDFLFGFDLALAELNDGYEYEWPRE